jgi:ABC-type dipeptide/oligopeptide/nickel transport system permease subunit
MTALSASTSASPETSLRSPTRLALRRFRKNYFAIAGLIVLILLVLACFGSLPWSLATPKDAKVPRYQFQMSGQLKKPPTADFWMGTNSLGQDLRPRFFFGGAISLTLGIASAMIAVLIGSSVGLLAGYAGGRTDAFLMRLVDILYGLPYILLVIIMRVALVPVVLNILEHKDAQGQTQWLNHAAATQWANFLVLLVGIGSVSWLTLARVVRGQVLSLRDQPFIEAARALGFPPSRIILRHILPNILGTIIVYGTLTVPAAVLSESFLSFLGLGIQPPVPSWGNLASEGLEALNPVEIRWWLIAWPCAGLSLALLALNFVGDGIREAFDPKAA